MFQPKSKIKKRRGRPDREQIGYWPIAKIIAWVERYEREGRLSEPFDTRNVKLSEMSAARKVARRIVSMRPPNLRRWNVGEDRFETEAETIDRVSKDVKNMLAKGAKKEIKPTILSPRVSKSFVAVKSYFQSVTDPHLASRTVSRRTAKN